MRRAPLVFASLSILWSSLALAAPPSDGHDRAAESFRQAQAAFQRGDFAAAAAAFEQAAGFEPHPAPLMNAADAWERAGEWARAAEDCDRVLAMPSAEAEYRSTAEQCIVKLAPRVATLDLRGPQSVAVRIDGGAELRVPARRRLAPGRHVVTFDDLATSRSRRAELEVAAGATRTLDAAPPEPPTPAIAPSAPARAKGLPPSAVVAFSFAGAAAIVGGVFGAMTLASKDDYNGNPTASTRDTFHRDKTITNVAFAACGFAGAAGVVLWIATPRRTGGATVGIAATGDGARAAFALAF